MIDNEKLIARLQLLKTAVERGKQEKARLEGQLQVATTQLGTLGFKRPEAATAWLDKEETDIAAAEAELAAKVKEIEDAIPR